MSKTSISSFAEEVDGNGLPAKRREDDGAKEG